MFLLTKNILPTFIKNENYLANSTKKIHMMDKDCQTYHSWEVENEDQKFFHNIEGFLLQLS